MKTKILVVEDDEAVRATLQSALSDDHTEVSIAADGKEALEVVAKIPPDLILLDVCMPRMNGYDTCRALREDPRTRNIPIIMISALRELSDHLHGLKCGADDYLTKPFDFNWLGSKVRNLLLRQRIRAGNAESMSGAKSDKKHVE